MGKVKAFTLGIVMALMIIPIFVKEANETNYCLGAIAIMLLYQIFYEEEKKGR